MKYGSVPTVFKIEEAARVAAQAYTIEDNELWTVMYKTITNGEKWYKPISFSDYDTAIIEGYRHIPVDQRED